MRLITRTAIVNTLDTLIPDRKRALIRDLDRSLDEALNGATEIGNRHTNVIDVEWDAATVFGTTSLTRIARSACIASKETP